jgi:hypothetical protein
VIADEVGRDRVQPGGKFERGLESISVLVHPGEALQGDFLGVLQVAEASEQIVEKPGGVPIHQVVQCCVVASGQPEHVVAILRLGGYRAHGKFGDTSGLRQAVCNILSFARPRLTFSKISVALAVHTKGFGAAL